MQYFGNDNHSLLLLKLIFSILEVQTKQQTYDIQERI